MLVPLGQVVLVPVACPSGTELVLIRYRHHPSKVGPWPILGSSKDLSKTKEVLIEFWKFLIQESLSNWSKIENKNRYFSLFLYKLNAGPKGLYNGSIENKLPTMLEANSGGWFGLERASAATTSSITRITTPTRGASRWATRSSLHHLGDLV